METEKKKLLPPVYVLASIVLMAALHFLAPAAWLIPSGWNFLGVIPLAIGIVINIVADKAFRRAGTTVKPFEESSSLVTTGVYRFSRHPMYLGLVLIALGIATIMGSLTPLVIVAILALLLDRVFISVEERMLEQRFGLAWLEYKKRVRRWI
jgi:protein-S-isoprenylcysteine O-methyltransferase Ste14